MRCSRSPRRSRCGAACPSPGLPHRGGGIAHHLRNLRLIGVSVCAGALFFTFVGTFTYVIFRLEEPPFSYSVAASSLVFLLWLTGLIGAADGPARRAGRLATRRARHRAPLRLSGVLLTLPNALPLLVLGLACVASAMFAGVTAAQLGISDVARVDRGAATALYFSIYYASALLGPTSRASRGRSGATVHGVVARPRP